jgi:hypothetical protein
MDENRTTNVILELTNIVSSSYKLIEVYPEQKNIFRLILLVTENLRDSICDDVHEKNKRLPKIQDER